MSSYLADLKKLYKEAFPAGDQGASILLRKFMSDLRPEIAMQVLLKTEPTTLEIAAKAARNVEQVLGLTKEDVMLVSSLTEVKGDKETPEMKQLVEAVATITAKMDNLQRQLDESRKQIRTRASNVQVTGLITCVQLVIWIVLRDHHQFAGSVERSFQKRLPTR